VKIRFSILRLSREAYGNYQPGYLSRIIFLKLINSWAHWPGVVSLLPGESGRGFMFLLKESITPSLEWFLINRREYKESLEDVKKAKEMGILQFSGSSVGYFPHWGQVSSEPH